jgi:hypothetical protein
MFDTHVVRYITDYLKLCDECDIYDINNYNHICINCKKFHCDKCSKNLVRNYNNFETTSNYCKPCNNIIFSYMYK